MSFMDRFRKTPTPRYDLTGMVDKYYMMNTDTEAFLWNGKKLKEDMRVLLVSSSFRVDLRYIEDYEDYEIAKRVNRWCTVSQLEHSEIPNLTSFVGIYDDGTEVPRSYNTTHAWLVKLDSLEKWEDALDEIPEFPSEINRWLLDGLNIPKNLFQGYFDADYNEYKKDYIKNGPNAWCGSTMGNVIPMRGYVPKIQPKYHSGGDLNKPTQP